MEDVYLKLANEILQTVDSYCNLDSLWEMWYWEEETYYEQLQKWIADMIREFSNKREEEKRKTIEELEEYKWMYESLCD